MAYDLEYRNEEATRTDISLSSAMIINLDVRDVLSITLARSIRIASTLRNSILRRLRLLVNREANEDRRSELAHISAR